MISKLSQLACSVSLLGGCALLPPSQQEVVSFYGEREFNQLRQTNLPKEVLAVGGFFQMFPTPLQREQATEQQLCLHRNSRMRVVQQQGRVGQSSYRQCPVTAHPASGMRLDNPSR